MGLLLVLAGSVLGFFVALFGYFVFDLTALTALALWLAPGPLMAGVAVLLCVAAPNSSDTQIPQVSALA
ncbi:MAG: hypothetical protein JKX69_08400 [Rhodobacteraceae bacterium]|nr:hypothetical protein [Paracoccaceae bacterium]